MSSLATPQAIAATPTPIEVLENQITITGAITMLALEGVRPHRRTVLRFVKKRGYPTQRIGTVTLLPRRIVPDFIADWQARHADEGRG